MALFRLSGKGETKLYFSGKFLLHSAVSDHGMKQLVVDFLFSQSICLYNPDAGKIDCNKLYILPVSWVGHPGGPPNCHATCPKTQMYITGKSRFRCKKNTWHVESNHILQPPKYLIIVVDWFRYINNNFTKDRCSIPMDMTVALGLHKFSPQAIIDHQGPSMYFGHYTSSISCYKKHSIATTAKLQSLKWLIPKTPLLLMR